MKRKLPPSLRLRKLPEIYPVKLMEKYAGMIGNVAAKIVTTATAATLYQFKMNDFAKINEVF